MKKFSSFLLKRPQFNFRRKQSYNQRRFWLASALAFFVGVSIIGNWQILLQESKIIFITPEVQAQSVCQQVGPATGDDTAQIQSAIDSCNEAILISGQTYTAEQLILGDGDTLNLNGATLIMEVDSSSGHPAYPYKGQLTSREAFIYGKNVSNVKLLGPGRILVSPTSSGFMDVVGFVGCQDVVIRDLEINSLSSQPRTVWGGWHIETSWCQDILVDNISVLGNREGKTGDCIALGNTTRGIVRNVNVNCWDDGIWVRGETHDFLIENSTVSSAAAGILIGNGRGYSMSNITIRDVIIYEGENAIKFKFRDSDLAENITIENVTINPNVFHWAWGQDFNSCDSGPCYDPPANQADSVVRNFCFSNITVNSGTGRGSAIIGDNDTRIENLTFNNVKFTDTGRADSKPFVSFDNVKGLTLADSGSQSDYSFSGVTGLTVTNSPVVCNNTTPPITPPTEPPILPPSCIPNNSGLKFQKGDKVKTTANLNVRVTPSTSGLLLFTQPLGSFGTIMEGPMYSGGYTWWKVDYDINFDGWSVENYLELVSPRCDVTPPTIPPTLPPTGSCAPQTLTVFPNGSVANSSALASGVSYKVTAQNTYNYWSGNSQNPKADAEYVETAPLDGRPGWNQPTPDPKLMELMINDQDVNWGSFSPSNTYSCGVTGTGNPLSFKVNDDYYPDNNGSLKVTVECGTAVQTCLGGGGQPPTTIPPIILPPTIPPVILPPGDVPPPGGAKAPGSYPLTAIWQWAGGNDWWYAKHDLVFTRTDDPNFVNKVRAQNPDIIWIMTNDFNSACEEGFINCDEADYLHDRNGNRVDIAYFQNAANLSGLNGSTLTTDIPNKVGQKVAAIADPNGVGLVGQGTDGMYDGAHYSFPRNSFSNYNVDMSVSNWSAGVNAILSGIRDAIGPKGIFIMNPENEIPPQSAVKLNLINGYTHEYSSWPETGTWETDVLNRWKNIASKVASPAVFLQQTMTDKRDTGIPGSTKDYLKIIRFKVAEAVMLDRYFEYEHVDGKASDHFWNNWYDELDLDLGKPTSDVQKVKSGVWVRFFENGVAILAIADNPGPVGNPTKITVNNSEISGLTGYAGPYHRFMGGQDMAQNGNNATNNGQPFSSITFDSYRYFGYNDADQAVGDGIILLKSSQSVVSDIIIETVESGTSPTNQPAKLSGGFLPLDCNSAIDYYEVRCDTWSSTSSLATASPGASGTATFTPNIGVPGKYEVYEWHGALKSGPSASNAQHTINYASGSEAFSIDQTQNVGQWNKLGVYQFDAGINGNVTISATGANGTVMADAIMFRYAEGGGAVCTPNTSGLKFQKGDKVKTTANLNVRVIPSTSGLLLFTQPLGSFGTIMEGPMYSGGYTWWKVDYDINFDGWSVENYLELVSPRCDATPPTTIPPVILPPTIPPVILPPTIPPVILPPTIPPSSGNTGAFLETGGLVVMEAENYTSEISRNSQSWEKQTNTGGYSGSGFVTALPDFAVNNDVLYKSTSPETQYPVKITSAGKYYVWVRGTGLSGNDSVHIGLNGVESLTADRIQLPVNKPFEWTRATMDGVTALLDIPTGYHLINMWMREDGANIDKILLTKNASYVPTGLGPSESQREVISTLSSI